MRFRRLDKNIPSEERSPEVDTENSLFGAIVSNRGEEYLVEFVKVNVDNGCRNTVWASGTGPGLSGDVVSSKGTAGSDDKHFKRYLYNMLAVIS